MSALTLKSAITVCLLLFVSSALALASQSLSAKPPAPQHLVPQKIVVLDFELNDLTYTENNQAEVGRTATLAPMLREALNQQATFEVIPLSNSEYQAANQGFGYLIQHPSAAAQLGEHVRADWVVVTRLHKPSFLFAYLIAHPVHVPSGIALPERIVEIKGQQEKLNRRGISKLADQITQQILDFTPPANAPP